MDVSQDRNSPVIAVENQAIDIEPRYRAQPLQIELD